MKQGSTVNCIGTLQPATVELLLTSASFPYAEHGKLGGNTAANG
ncbi:hypothetical protein [Vreelandella alkaliphila]